MERDELCANLAGEELVESRLESPSIDCRGSRTGSGQHLPRVVECGPMGDGVALRMKRKEHHLVRGLKRSTRGLGTPASRTKDGVHFIALAE